MSEVYCCKNFYSTNYILDKHFLIEKYHYNYIPEKRNKFVVLSGFKKTKYIVYDDGVIYHYIPEYDVAKEVKSWDLKGYRRIGLRDEKGKVNQFYVHRIIAMLFISNPENKPEVNHKNRKKADNRVENLEWVTKLENELHKRRTGCIVTEETKEKIRKANKGKNSYRAKKVICLETGKIYDTAKEASFALGRSKNVVSQACKDGRAVKNFHFKYI